MTIPPMRWRYLIAGLAVAVALAAAAMIPSPPQLAPLCAHEDANGCFWDARTLGNGEGSSFYACDDGHLIVFESRPTLAEATDHCR